MTVMTVSEQLQSHRNERTDDAKKRYCSLLEMVRKSGKTPTEKDLDALDALLKILGLPISQVGTDLASLQTYCDLAPIAHQIDERFEAWMSERRRIAAEQIRWDKLLADLQIERAKNDQRIGVAYGKLVEAKEAKETISKLKTASPFFPFECR